MLSLEAQAIEQLFYIQPKEGGPMVPYVLNNAQRFFDGIDRQEGHLNLIIAKARQKGFSSILLAKFDIRCMGREGTHAVTISHEGEATVRLFDRAHFYLKHMNGPKPMFGRNSRNETYFSKTESTFFIGTAGAKAFGRGDTITDLHCCIHPDVWVLNSNNKAIPISEVGAPTLINYSGRVIKIVLWMCPKEGLVLTPEHKVLTQRGFVRADKLTLDDSVVYKKRPLTQTIKTITGMDRIRMKRGLGQGKGSSWKDEPFHIKLTYEFGRICGLFLAEGSLYAPYATFALHRKEDDLVDWLRQYFGEDGIDVRERKNDEGIEVYIKGIKWFHTFSLNFGGGENKELPNWVFDAPTEFLFGLVEGLFRGDGWHHFYSESSLQVCIGQVRSQIVFQLRDLMCSLGFGFSSVKNGYSYKGQKNLMWTLSLSGEGAKKLINLLYGIKVPECSRGSYGTTKYTETDEEIHIRIKGLEEKEVENITFYDLLNQPDGLIRTPYGCISNSEYAWWDDPIKHSTGLFQAVPYSGRIYLESTGNGRNNDFYYIWKHAEGMGFERLFYPWFADIEYSLPLPAHMSRWKPDLPAQNMYMLEMARKYNLSDQQMYWYEGKLKSLREDIRLMQQEYPFEPDECFQASGGAIFGNIIMSNSPMWHQEKWLNTDPYVLSPHPIPNFHYALGCDPSGGTGNDDAAIVVICAETGDQVFEFAANNIDPYHFAIYVCKVAARFNNAFIVPESNNHGAAVVNILIEQYKKDRIYKSKYATATSAAKYGWNNTTNTKHVLVGTMLETLPNIQIYGKRTVTELEGFEEDESGRMEGARDNLVISCGLAIIGYKKFEHYRIDYDAIKPKEVMLRSKTPNGMVFTLDEVLKNIEDRYNDKLSAQVGGATTNIITGV
jgi:hypothetical protein